MILKGAVVDVSGPSFLGLLTLVFHFLLSLFHPLSPNSFPRQPFNDLSFFWTNCSSWSTLFLDILAFVRRQPGCRLFSFQQEIPAKHCSARLFAPTRQPIPMIMLTPKSFRIRTSKPSRKCSFQRTYRNVKSFRIRTYKKPRGVGAAPQAPYPSAVLCWVFGLDHFVRTPRGNSGSIAPSTAVE